MDVISLAQAKANLGELIDQVERGRTIVITRHGRPMARLSPIRLPKLPVRPTAAFRARLPRWRKQSAALLREARDDAL